MTYRPLRIKDLPKSERPRERLHKYGPESLKDSELLAIILKSGFKGTTAVQLGEQILTALEGDLKRMADYKIQAIREDQRCRRSESSTDRCST